jgi:hypothetical protein
MERASQSLIPEMKSLAAGKAAVPLAPKARESPFRPAITSNQSKSSRLTF